MSYDSKGTVNKVILIGRVGQDPELKYTSGGTAFLNLSVATNTSHKGQDGNKTENTEWNRVIVWRKLAEMIAQYAKKGTRVYVEGKLQTRSWEADGQKKYITEIVAENMQLLESRQSGESYQAPPAVNQAAEAFDAEPVDGDDLPF